MKQRVKLDPEDVAKRRTERKAERQAQKREGRLNREKRNAITILAGMKPRRWVQ